MSETKPNQRWQLGNHVVKEWPNKTVLTISDILFSQVYEGNIYKTNDGTYWDPNGNSLNLTPKTIETATDNDTERYHLEELKRQYKMIIENAIVTNEEASKCKAALLQITQKRFSYPPKT